MFAGGSEVVSGRLESVKNLWVFLLHTFRSRSTECCLYRYFLLQQQMTSIASVALTACRRRQT